MTPPEGLRYGETFIPGNTVVQIPTYTVHRGRSIFVLFSNGICFRRLLDANSYRVDERLYVQQNDFIPERWTTKPELTKDASAFAPFSTGKHHRDAMLLANETD